jgi:hypothetical protein
MGYKSCSYYRLDKMTSLYFIQHTNMHCQNNFCCLSYNTENSNVDIQSEDIPYVSYNKSDSNVNTLSKWLFLRFI